MTSPPAAVATTICTSRRRNPGSDPNAVPKPREHGPRHDPADHGDDQRADHHARDVPERERRDAGA